MAYTGVGHGTDRAVTLGLHGYLPNTIINEKISEVIERVWAAKSVPINVKQNASFFAENDIIFDTKNLMTKLHKLHLEVAKSLFLTLRRSNIVQVHCVKMAN